MAAESVQATISPTLSVLYVISGILISLVLPVAVRTLRSAKSGLEVTEGTENKPTLASRILAAWKTYGGNRYLQILLATIVIAVVLVFLLGMEFSAPRDAALAGFAWESLVNKLYSSASES